jgi:small GTP-binding protein
MERNVTIKMILLGDSMVGKSRISSVLDGDLETNGLNSSYLTIGVDYRILRRTVYGDIKNIYRLHVWDGGGLLQYRDIIRSYYRCTIAAIIVFDVNNLESFHNVQNWVNDYLNITKDNYRPQPYRTLIIVGNKIDNLNRIVKFEDGYNLAKKLGCQYTECSALKNINTESIINKLIIQIEDDYLNNKISHHNPNFKVNTKIANGENYFVDKYKKKTTCEKIGTFFKQIYNFIKDSISYCFCCNRNRNGSYYQIM